jgi:hypothetical protein
MDSRADGHFLEQLISTMVIVQPPKSFEAAA